MTEGQPAGDSAEHEHPLLQRILAIWAVETARHAASVANREAVQRALAEVQQQLAEAELSERDAESRVAVLVPTVQAAREYVASLAPHAPQQRQDEAQPANPAEPPQAAPAQRTIGSLCLKSLSDGGVHALVDITAYVSESRPDMTRRRVSAALTTLCDKRLVRRVGHGLYQLAAGPLREESTAAATPE